MAGCRWLEISHSLQGRAWQIVVEEACVVAEIGRPHQPLPGQTPTHEGNGENDRQHDAVIKRKDPQSAANVKIADTMWIVTRIKQNAGDEEAGEDEEEIDTSPAPGHLPVMLEKDREKCDSPQTVESWIESPVFRFGVRGIAGDNLGIGGHNIHRMFK